MPEDNATIRKGEETPEEAPKPPEPPSPPRKMFMIGLEGNKIAPMATGFSSVYELLGFVDEELQNTRLKELARIAWNAQARGAAPKQPKG